MATNTELEPISEEAGITMREFFDLHKIPYCLVRHEFYDEVGEDGTVVRKKR